MEYLNLTQHIVSEAQDAAGVVEPADKDEVQKLLTFDTIPYEKEMEVRAENLAKIAMEEGFNAVMIGGATFFMSTLEKVLKENDIAVFYAFSIRESIDIKLPDGSIKKSSVFKHVGFVSV